MEMSLNRVILKMCWDTSPFKCHGNISINHIKVKESPIIHAYIYNWLTSECLKLARRYFYKEQTATGNKTLKKASQAKHFIKSRLQSCGILATIYLYIKY